MSSQSPYLPPSSSGLSPQGSPTSLSPKEILFSFSGRIPRRTYWLWTLVSAGGFMAIFFILSLVLGQSEKTQGLLMILLLLLYIPWIWISLALQTKRWHDRNKSGLWCLIAFVPIIGGIWAFVEVGCLRGTFGLNNYGQDPT